VDGALGVGVVGPEMSVVPAMLTTWVPCAAVAGWVGVDPLVLAVVAPRVVVALASVVVDVFIARTFDFVGGEGAKAAVLCWASAWTAFVLLPRPSVFFLEAICVAALLYASLGLIDRWIPMFVTLAFTFGFGIHVRSAFLGYFLLTFLHFFTLATRPSFTPKKVLPAAAIGTILFLTILFSFGFVDSLYHGTLRVKLDGQIIPFFDILASLRRLGEMKFEGHLTMVPINNVLKLRHVGDVRLLLQANLSQVFGTMPLMLGPLLVTLIRDSWDGTKRMYKELSSEFKNISTGQGLGGKKKKKKKKVPAVAAQREEDLATFLDIIQTTYLIILLIEVALNASQPSLLSMLPVMIPASMLFGDRIFGPKREPLITAFFFAYTALGIVLFGLCVNGAVSTIGKSLSHPEVEPFVPAGSEVVFYETSLPPSFFPGQNPHRVTLTDPNVSSVTELFEQLDLKSAERDDLYLIAPGTSALDEQAHSLELVKSWSGHLSTHKPPGNADEVVTKNRLLLYRYLPPAARYASSDAADNGEDNDMGESQEDQDEEGEL